MLPALSTAAAAEAVASGIDPYDAAIGRSEPLSWRVTLALAALDRPGGFG